MKKLHDIIQPLNEVFHVVDSDTGKVVHKHDSQREAMRVARVHNHSEYSKSGNYNRYIIATDKGPARKAADVLKHEKAPDKTKKSSGASKKGGFKQLFAKAVADALFGK